VVWQEKSVRTCVLECDTRIVEDMHVCILYKDGEWLWLLLPYTSFSVISSSCGQFCCWLWYRESKLRSLGLRCIHSSQRGYPSLDGAHIGISK